MTLQEKQMLNANIKLQDEIINIKSDIKILIDYILGYTIDGYLIENIINKYKNINYTNSRGHYEKRSK